jgi:hypothetical protein
MIIKYLPDFLNIPDGYRSVNLYGSAILGMNPLNNLFMGD